MTLRATIEIVPYGDETSKREIFRLDISNMGVVEPGPFGHDICKYKVKLFGKVDERLRKEGEPEWEHFETDWVERHDRRDGAVALVAKAAELMKERA